MITESDRILTELEQHFGPLGEPIARLTPQRQLERTLFRAWCDWLCRPSRDAREERQGQRECEEVAATLHHELL